MYRKLALLLCVSALSITVSAQQVVQGKVLDKDNEGVIEFAAVRLLKKADSTLVTGVNTDSRGAFLLNKVKDGSYIVEVRFINYENSFVPVEVAGKNVIVKNIYLQRKAQELNEITVEGIAAQMVIKGDTIEYNPAAFKLAENAVVEDLLKKLPGVTVDSDGKITVNGEEIRRIRVDGKKFFDGDMQMTTRNMPADMVDKVQVIDLKSEQARLTGFEDENTERIINLTIKENRRQGVFGNATLGGGMDKDKVALYDANAFVNVWLGDLRTTVTGGANNANSMRSGRGRGGMMGGGGGRTSTENIGININAELGTKTIAGGDVSYNHSSSESTTDSERDSYTRFGTNYTKSNNSSTRSNQEAGLSGEVEWVPDTISTFVFQPRINMGWSESMSGGNSDYFTIVDDTINNVADTTQTSSNYTNSSSLGTNNSANLTLMYNRKSPVKKGRTMTLNMTGSLSTSNTDGKNYNEKLMHTLNDSVAIIDQENTNTSNSFNTNIRFSFVEPIFNLNNYLQLGVTFSANSSKSEKMQYNMGPDSIYNMLDSAYSNRYNNLTMNQNIDLTFQHRETNYNYQIGITAQPFQNSSFNDYFIGQDREIKQSGINFSPNARLQYNLMPATGTTTGITGARNRSFIRLDYRGRMQQPSVQQMQPVKNNDNLMRETVGNPDLIPSYNQNFQLQFSHNNSEKLSSMSLGLSGSFTQNQLVQNTIIDQTGKNWSQTVNAVDLPFNINPSITYNTPIFKNRLQFNSNTSGSFSRSYSYSDQSRSANPFQAENPDLLRLGDKGISNSWNASERISLTFTTDWLEIGATGNMQYRGSKNTLNNNKLTETFTWSGTGNINLILPYNLNISNDFGYTARSGYSSYTKNELLWNASVQKSVFNSLGTVTLTLNDILQQRQNISESISDNSRSLSTSNSLTSYFMLSFTYRISQFGGAGGGRGGMGGMGGGRGGMGGMGGGGMGGMGGGGMF